MQIFVAKNKDGNIRVFLDCPTRRGDCWVGTYFVNSVVQAQLENELKEVSTFTFESDPFTVELTANQNN